MVKCLLQVCDEVVYVFGTNGKAYRALVDALVCQLCLRKLGMCGGGGVDDEGFDIGYIREQREQLQGVNEAEGFFAPALDLEGEDGAATLGEVPLIGDVVRVAREAGMVHLGNLGVFG